MGEAVSTTWAGAGEGSGPVVPVKKCLLIEQKAAITLGAFFSVVQL